MKPEERSDYSEWEALQDWYETSMIVWMLGYLYQIEEELPDNEYQLFSWWYDDVDIQTGVFGR